MTKCKELFTEYIVFAYVSFTRVRTRTTKLGPNVVDERLALLLRIPEVPGSNLGTMTCYHD
jgi:hypothetical protein